ncbi:MAG: SSI family serine proteinase inhibitor [Streptomyces sp.]|uniref:SSI family serine proteinase inhibitor n=1 Tax=Streptomyces sp. TaxID=1931 RepID=UPI003D6B7396
MPRRSATATVLASVPVLLAVTGGLLSPAAAAPDSSRLPMPPARSDQLRFTVTDSGNREDDGTYRLECNPAGGSHPRARAACEVLTSESNSGRHPFGPVPTSANCTLMYGGPATAHVVGVWHGREVDATFRRTDGCEIERWDALVPALPRTSTGW